MLMYQHRHTPVWIVEFPTRYTADDTDKKVELNKTVAEQLLKNAKNMGGIYIPKFVNAEGKVEEGWKFYEAVADDREISFMDSIKIMNTSLYIAALMPERLTEQFKQTGSEAMVRVQRGFYEANVVETRLKETAEYLRTWIIDPMLKVNFGKIDCEVSLTVGDKTIDFLGQVLLEMIKQGAMDRFDLDTKDIAERIGLKTNPLRPEPTIEKEERTQIAGMEFQRTRKQQSKVIKKIEKEWVEYINKHLKPLKEKCYNEIVANLRQTQGTMGLKVMAVKDDIIKADKLAKLVQMPRSDFEPIGNYLYDAFYIGFSKVIKDSKEKVAIPDKLPIEAKRELDLLIQKFKGIGGKNVIGGQPELLEERLFYAIMSAAQKSERISAFNTAFNNYIEVTLPDNTANEINIAQNKGLLYGKDFLVKWDMQKKKIG